MAHMELPARLENLEKLQNFIAECASTCLSPRRIDQVLLAAEEALVNIFNYAYPEDQTKNPPGTVKVSCEKTPDNHFQIQFEDRGKPFDMLAKDDPDTSLSLEDRPIGGLGIFFIRKMTDQVHYCRADGKNILTFIIHPA
jgi:anti-sigma regulatory factor (Ser/Thr protein kinase)